MSTAVLHPTTARDGAGARPGLGRLTTVELRKMVDTRAGLWLQAATAILTLLAVVVLVLAGDARDQTLAQMLSVTAFPTAVLLPVMGILLVTSEWTQRTTLISFALVPQRSRVLVAKLLAGLVLAVAASVLCLVLAVLGTALAGSDAENAWSLGLPLLGQVALSLVTGMVTGLGFGMLLLASAPAIVLYFALPIGFSAVGLIPALERVAGWLDPSRTLAPLTEELLSGAQWARALVSLALWMLLPLAVGWWRVMRSEVR